MSLRINNNVEAFNAHRQLTQTSEKMAKAMERLSSGSRINRAADDAAGLAISEKMRSQIGGLAQAQRNAQDGISLVQTAEGALNEVHSILQRVRDLKVQYDNGTLAQADRDAIKTEVTALGAEVTRIATGTQFNGNNLFGTTSTTTFGIKVGANGTDTISVGTFDLSGAMNQATSVTAGTDTILGTADDVSGTADAGNIFTQFGYAGAGAVSVSMIDEAIAAVSTARAGYGATQNRLEHTVNSLATYQENLVASESRIRDVDMAKEMVDYTKFQILQQAGTAMLAQANQAPQGVLSLLR